MPAIMEQVSRLSVSEKLNLMECIIKSIGMSVVAAEPVKPVRASRIGICRGMWKLPYTDYGIADDQVFEGRPSADGCVILDPRDATPEIGKKYFTAALENLCDAVTEAYQNL